MTSMMRIRTGVPRARRRGWWVGPVSAAIACLLGVQGVRGAGAETAEGAGLEALKQSRFGEARETFERRRSEAEAGGDAAGAARACFYLGLVDQQEASSADAAARTGLLESASKHYREALEKGPESAGILNNLARAEAGLGRTNEALASLSRASELDDPRRGFYAENYADLLLAAGRWRDACRIYASVAREQPQNRAVHDKMVDACVRMGPDLLAWYLWDLAAAGQAARVLDSALSVMREPVWNVAQREELMALVAHCLARRKETRPEFEGSKSAEALRALVGDPVVGPAALGILHLYGPGPFAPVQVAWWTRRDGGGSDPRRGQWPLDAFLDLVRALGDRAGIEGMPELQEAYWMLAVGMKPGSPDPEALWLLANVYSDRRDLTRLDTLMKQYEVDIFRAKGEAYSSAQTRKIYRYHMALGVIYSELDRWTSPRQVDSAMFQLRRALETADHINAKAEAAGDPSAAQAPVVVPPRLVDLLASGYEKTGQQDASARLRLEQADKYLRLDQPEAAVQVMAPLRVAPRNPNVTPAPPRGWNDADKAKWKDIDERLRRAKSPTVPVAGANAVGAGAVSVRVGSEANVVAGGGDRWKLSEKDRRSVEQSVSNVVRQIQGRKAGTVRLGNQRAVGTEGPGAEIQEVDVRGNRGRVVLRQGTNLVQVPIRLEGGTNNTVPRNLRFVRP